MGRRSHTARLNVFMNGVHVGVWSQSPKGETFRYAPSWLGHDHFRPISLSLLPSPGNPELSKGVDSYFDNLLPDSTPIRKRLAGRYDKDPNNSFELLSAIGRDCVGALQILPESERPEDIESIHCQPMTEAQVAEHLRQIPMPANRKRRGEGDLRISLAGAQEKTALLWHEDRWAMPQGTTPSSHIFKLPLGLIANQSRYDLSDSVENEWLCAKLCEAFDLPVARCHIGRFEDQKALVVERFDRAYSEDATWIMRLPQEDMCQALGYPNHQKYESDGGPGIEEIMELLRASEQSDVDRLNFYRAQFFFWLIAGIDGHAKNFSIALLPRGRFHMTPFYDVLSAHTIIGSGKLPYAKTTLAMCVSNTNRHYRLGEILYRHWIGMGARLGLGGQIEPALECMLDQVDDVIERVTAQLPEDFPGGTAQKIFDGIRSQCDKAIRQRASALSDPERT